MASVCSTNRGRSARAPLATLAAIALLLAFPRAALLAAETELVPSRIDVGDTASLRVTLSDVDDAEPASMPRVPGLEISYNGVQHFSNVQIINGQMKKSSGVVLNYSITPDRPGTFIIPSLSITADGRRFASRAVTLFVSRGESRSRTHTSSRTVRLSGIVEVPRRAVFVGEPLVVRYFLLYSGVEFEQKPVVEKLPETRGFVQKIVEERLEDAIETRGGVELIKSHYATYALIPTQAGEFAVGGGSVIVVAGSRDEFFGFSFPRQRRVSFAEERVSVRALPGGAPADFQGNVGSFTVEQSKPGERVPVFEEAKVTVRVRGRGNISSLSRPVFIDATEHLKVIGSDGRESVRIEQNALAGEKEFVFSLIPERPGRFTLQGFRINFFNPESMRYETTEGGRISFEATGDGSRRTGKGNGDAKTGEGGIDMNYVVIALALAAVAAIVVAVILWERRRFRAISKAVEREAAGRNTRDTRTIDAAVPLADLSTSMRRGDAAHFMKAAEIALNAIERAQRGRPVDTESAAQAAAIKEKLYGWKYGGCALSAADMDALHRELQHLAKRLS